MSQATIQPSSRARSQMRRMPPIVYVDEVADFEEEGCSCVKSVESVESSGGGTWMLGIGMVGREEWVGEGG